MLTALAILGVLAALFLVAALATRDDQALQPVSRDAADLALPSGALAADDVRGLRFGLAARGYRMSEVDEALARLAGELEQRDRRLSVLTGEPGSAPVSLEKGTTAAFEEPEATAVVRRGAAPRQMVETAPLVPLELPTRPAAPPREPADDGFPQVHPADDLSSGEAPHEPVDPPVRP